MALNFQEWDSCFGLRFLFGEELDPIDDWEWDEGEPWPEFPPFQEMPTPVFGEPPEADRLWWEAMNGQFWGSPRPAEQWNSPLLRVLEDHHIFPQSLFRGLWNNFSVMYRLYGVRALGGLCTTQCTCKLLFLTRQRSVRSGCGRHPN